MSDTMEPATETDKPALKYFLHNPKYHSWQLKFRNQADLPLDHIKMQFSKYGEVLKVVQPDYLGTCFVHFKTRDAARLCALGLRNSASIKLLSFRHEFASNYACKVSCENNLIDNNADDTAFNKSNEDQFQSSEQTRNNKFRQKSNMTTAEAVKQSHNEGPSDVSYQNGTNENVYTSTPTKIPANHLNVNKRNPTDNKSIYPKPMKDDVLRNINNNSMNETLAPASSILPNNVKDQEIREVMENGMLNGKKYHDGSENIPEDLGNVNNSGSAMTVPAKAFVPSYMRTQVMGKDVQNGESKGLMNQANMDISANLINKGEYKTIASKPILRKPLKIVQSNGVEKNNESENIVTAAKNQENCTELSKNQESNNLKNDSGIELAEDNSHNFPPISRMSLSSSGSRCSSSSESHSSDDHIADHLGSSGENSTAIGDNSMVVYKKNSAGMPSLVKKPQKPQQKPMEIVIPSPTYPYQMPMMYPLIQSACAPPRPTIPISKPLHNVVVANIHEFLTTESILEMLQQYQPICATKVDTAPPYNIRFCYVYFDSYEKAKFVEKNFDRAEAFGKKLIVLRSTTLAKQAAHRKETVRAQC
uniref:RRM domain-containing protein n=1 Tax=Bracon brevicornis TaxID=1563983 RepID=A0A6V7HZS0_9HYME